MVLEARRRVMRSSRELKVGEIGVEDSVVSGAVDRRMKSAGRWRRGRPEMRSL